MAPMDQHRQNFFWKYNVFQHKTNEQTNKKNVKNRQRNKEINNRQKTLLHKAYELGEFVGVEIIVIIKKYGKYITYVSKGYKS